MPGGLPPGIGQLALFVPAEAEVHTVVAHQPEVVDSISLDGGIDEWVVHPSPGFRDLQVGRSPSSRQSTRNWRYTVILKVEPEQWPVARKRGGRQKKSG